MHLLKDLDVFLMNGVKYVQLDNFLQYLRNNHKESDSFKEVKRFNVVRELQKYKVESIIEYEGKTIIPFLSVLRYIFHHVDDFDQCKKIAKQITSSFQDTAQDHGSNLDLYKSICDLNLKGIILREFSEEISNTNFETVSLLENYKEHFDSAEWHLICLFEHHFSQFVNSPIELSYEETMKQKWSFLKSLQTTTDVSKKWLLYSNQAIKIRHNRFLSAKRDSDIYLQSALKHIPSQIDSFLLSKISLYYPEQVESIICTDTFNSDETNTVGINIEIEKGINFTDLGLIASRVTALLAEWHAVIVSHVNFFKPGSFETYVRPNDHVARFTLRDDLYLQKLDSFIIESFLPESDSDIIDIEHVDENGNCKSCFSNVALIKPLHMKKFDVIEEWLLDVPLPVQVIFERFINKDTLVRNANKKEFVKGKLLRLYALYDTLLNTSNKKHMGLLQKNNTDELLMNYHSIYSTFDITSSYGITSSLITAERKIKEKAIDDVCYFNTYIKKYPLKYKTDVGVVEKEVSLRDCHLILMLDNLVRLRYLSDPNPGDCRSMQMCTLPITIQGVPKDSSEIEEWHDHQICDGNLNCPCKEIKQASKSDVQKTLFDLLPEEQNSKSRFGQLCTWGNLDVLRLIEECNLIEYIPHVQRNEADILCTSSSSSGDSASGQPIEAQIEEDEQANHDDEDIHQMLQQVIVEEIDDDDEFDDLFLPLESHIAPDISHSMHSDYGASALDVSMANLSIHENDDQNQLDTEPVPTLFGFHKYTPPPLITKHPPPAVGRDDDINKLKEVLEDILLKTGYSTTNQPSADRILFGPDNKIGANLIKLVDSKPNFKAFLPEFPLLRKSKITVLFSGYKNAGLLHLVMYMTDNDKQEWSKLISAQHIDVATNYVRRLSVAFHTAFFVKFIHSLDSTSQEELLSDLKCCKPQLLAVRWEPQLIQFLENGSKANSTFALHMDMMNHCDEVLAVHLAERLGSESGYDLLLSAVKSSLLFGYVNGATSYAPFCTKLLIQHYSAGPFHQKMKKALFSTPIGQSEVNFSGDTKREMDHLDVLRSFRSGSNLNAVLNRMSLIDPLNEARSPEQSLKKRKCDKDMLGWKLNNVDVNHITRVVKLILRTGALSTEPCAVPYNMYTKEVTLLSSSMLDSNTFPVGKHLVERFLVKEALCDYTESDISDIDQIFGPKDLISRVKKSKGVTIRRSTQKVTEMPLTERDQKEVKRKKLLKKEVKQTDRLTSEMNTCQALLKPDCSKPKVQKSEGIQKALLNLIKDHVDEENISKLVKFNQNRVCSAVANLTKAATIEFAGVKFKTNVCSGEQYVKHIESAIIKSWMYALPSLKRLIICEEKYQFTPDDFKAATRQQRIQKSKTSISHLKHGDDILSEKKFNKEAIVTSAEGKSLISTYLAVSAKNISIISELCLDIDSELYINGCLCVSEKCTNSCQRYTTPIRCSFSKGQATIIQLDHIKQCKGEAEMAQVDWLFDIYPNLSKGDAIASIVSSGDIDAVVIHLFTLSSKWPRDENGKFLYPVYVLLQKPQRKLDIYDITGILQVLELSTGDRNIGQKLAVSVCIGGNDFIPKIYGQSHEKILQYIFKNVQFIQNLFEFKDNLLVAMDTDVFVNLVKKLYCPKKKDPSALTFEEVRENSMHVKRKSAESGLTTRTLRNAQLWMPPQSAIQRLADIINLQISYLLTVGDPSAPLPNFLESTCLKKRPTGEIEYDFGCEMQIDISKLVPLSAENPQKRKSDLANTPHKRERKKKPMTSTPKKRDI